MRKLLLLSGLLLILLVGFGCSGRSYRAPANPPSTNQPAGQIGDADIAPSPSPNENVISNEDVVPPDNSSSSANSANVSAGSGSALPDESDLVLSNTTNEDLISQEDIVGPS